MGSGMKTIWDVASSASAAKIEIIRSKMKTIGIEVIIHVDA